MAQYVKALKKILFKKSFDFNRSDIDIYVFHPQLLVSFTINGISFDKRNSALRFVWPIFGVSWSLVELVLLFISCYHFITIQDYGQATECFCYFIVVGIVPVIHVSAIRNSDNIRNMIDTMNKDFTLICNLGSRYRQPFLKRQLQIWQLCCVWFVFSVFLGVLHVMLPILQLCYLTLFATQDENTTRPLQYTMWLPNDIVYETPCYEFILCLETFLVVFFMSTFCAYLSSLFHILLHYYIIIILDMEVLFEGLDESAALLPRTHERRVETQHVLNRRVGRIVDMHNSVITAVKNASSVYGPLLVYQVLCTSIAVCTNSFQIAARLEEGSVEIVFIMLDLATCLQLWIPCYLGTLVRDKAFSVGDACWNCGWHTTSLGRLVRSDINIIIQQAQRPITIKFTGLPQINLETFSLQMSKAYSYFNMLRQYNN